MKKLIMVAVASALTLVLFAQAQPNFNAANPALIGNFTAQQRLKEVSVEKFENEGTWTVWKSADEGIIRGRLFEGSPAGKTPIPDEAELNIPDTMVYGVRVDYFRRGYNAFTVRPVNPLPVEGVVKTVSVWVVGRNHNHTLKLLLRDYWGNEFELYMGRLNHSGWKLMTAAIPPQNPDGRSGIIQKDFHYGTRIGLSIAGFKIECDPDSAYGTYFIYFDDLRAVADLFELEHRDPDDMSDNW